MNHEALPMSVTECERDLIGCALALIQSSNPWGKVADVVAPRHFQDSDLGRMWGAILDLHKSGKPVEPTLVLSTMKLAGFGGSEVVDLVANLSNRQPANTMMPHYGQQVVECYRMRELQRLAQGITAMAIVGHPGGADAIATKFKSAIEAVLSEGYKGQIVSLRDAMSQVVSAKLEKTALRVATGMKKLDEVIGGYPIGMVTLIGGRPGMGKSQLLKQSLLNASRVKIPAGIVTVEENRFKIAENLLSNVTNVLNHKIRLNRMDNSEMAVIDQWARECSLPFYIEDSEYGISGICRSIRRMVSEHKCEVVGVDYIQLIDPEGGHDTENREITLLSKQLKRLARELNIALVCAAQLNRAGAAEKRKPTLTDLRGSGSLEQDGDVILLMHREDYYHADDSQWVNNFTVEIGIAKNKDGNRTSVELNWDGDHQRIF